MWKMIKGGFLGLAVVLMVVLAGAIGYNVGDDSPTPGAASSGSEFDLLNEVYNILREDFVEPQKVSPAALEEGAIDGLINSLDDRHTTYIDPAAFASGVDPISGTFDGIGAQVSQDINTKQIVIVSPFRGSPAEQAGIRIGDVILEVDGQSTEGWSVANAVDKIRGPQGTSVRLKVEHSDGTTEEVTVVRRKIEVPTVFGNFGDNPQFKLVDANGDVVPDIAYVELQQFTEPAVPAMRKALKQVQDAGYKAIILDLRRNPGGSLDATAQITDMFMNKGIIITQVDRNGNRSELEGKDGGEATDIPLAILAGPGSASGAEVLAGALRDNGRAVLVGQTTFGKGSVNHLRELSNGGALYVTIARWLTPKGELIEGKGLQPDILVEPTEEENTTGVGPQLFAAIDYLRQEIKTPGG